MYRKGSVVYRDVRFLHRILTFVPNLTSKELWLE